MNMIKIILIGGALVVSGLAAAELIPAARGAAVATFLLALAVALEGVR